MTINEFLANIGFIEDTNPKYKLGHSGDDGYCDCIGLIIGALERGGIGWPGTHGFMDWPAGINTSKDSFWLSGITNPFFLLRS